MRKSLTGMLSRIAFSLAGWHAAFAQELTIFWAEWDPANYLQELVNEYEDETGVKVTVETTPWPDFQTKAFTEFNAKGDAYDMVVGDSQWLGAGSTGGHYVDLTDFFKQAQRRRDHGAGDGEVLRRISRQQRQVLGDPARRRRRRLGLSQGLVRGPEGDGSLQGQVRLRPRRAEGLQGSCATSPSSSTARTRRTTASPSIPTIPMTRMAMGFENAPLQLWRRARRLFDLQGRRHHQLRQGRRGARSLQGALQVHAAGLGQDVLRRGQPGDHREPGGDEHELLRLLPGAGQRGHQPERQEHRLLRQPGRPGRRPVSPRSAGRASRSSPTRRTRRRRSSSWSGSSRTRPRRSGPSSAATPATPRCWSREEFRNATPYNKAFYQTMFMVKDFWAVPEYAELLTAAQPAHLSVHRRRRGHGQGSARRARRRTGTRPSRSTAACK